MKDKQAPLNAAVIVNTSGGTEVDTTWRLMSKPV